MVLFESHQRFKGHFFKCHNDNILPSAGDWSMQQIVKDKEDCASIPTSSTKINKKIADYRQQKRQQQEVKFLMKIVQ